MPNRPHNRIELVVNFSTPKNLVSGKKSYNERICNKEINSNNNWFSQNDKQHLLPIAHRNQAHIEQKKVHHQNKHNDYYHGNEPIYYL